MGKINIIKFLLIGIVSTSLVHAAKWPIEDKVDGLPGYPNKLKNNWWSGYVDVITPSKPDNTLHYHYILVEADENPEDAPLVLWTNGGPGAASLWGLFSEIGPLWLTEESLKTIEFIKTGIPTPVESDTSWTKFANLLIMSGPPPVSFGYCDAGGPAGDGYSCGNWSDETTGEADFQFLEGFFKKFPAYVERKSDFFLTGESYAGIYIPSLVKQLLDHPDSVPSKLFKGFAIGDGCIGSDMICSVTLSTQRIIEQYFSVQFLYGHGQFPAPLYNEYIEQCKGEFDDYEHTILQSLAAARENKQFLPRTRSLMASMKPSEKCSSLYLNIRDIVSHFNTYGLYDECWEIPNVPLLGGVVRETIYKPYPCGASKVLDMYLAHDEVKKYLHAPEDAVFFSSDNGIGMHYHSTVRNLLPWYYKIATETDVKVLIYNGDADHELNSFFSSWWVEALQLALIEDWRAWTLDGDKEVVGYVSRYEGDFTYTTIRGSGHMVPTMKPRQALELLSSWVAGKNLKEASPVD